MQLEYDTFEVDAKVQKISHHSFKHNTHFRWFSKLKKYKLFSFMAS